MRIYLEAEHKYCGTKAGVVLVMLSSTFCVSHCSIAHPNGTSIVHNLFYMVTIFHIQIFLSLLANYACKVELEVCIVTGAANRRIHVVGIIYLPLLEKQ